jgi:hypothetical protein
MGVRELGLECMDWIYVAQDIDRWQVLVNLVMHLRFHKRHGVFFSTECTISFPRMILLCGVTYCS